MPFAMSLPRSKGWAPEVSRLDQAKEGFPYGSAQHARAECSMETLHHSQKDLEEKGKPNNNIEFWQRMKILLWKVSCSGPEPTQ
jgi:hypothetical protein